MLFGGLAMLIAGWMIQSARWQSEAWAPLLGFAIAAVVFGSVALFIGRRGTDRRVPRRRQIALGAWGVVLGLAAPLLAYTATPRLVTCRETPPRARCASNLRQLGQAAQLFANENGGRLPNDVDEFLTEDIVTGVFVCPATNDTPGAPAPTTQATAANVKARGHCSYVYVGKGWRADKATADVVLAYEPLSNHGGAGMNVLYGDGHVDWLGASEANKLLAELSAGHNPPQLR
jgi:prepilin-type processing-associated H-X9-DG protein